MSKTIIQIVPRLPPAIDGLGDYALNLAYQLKLYHDIETIFIVGDPEWRGENNISGFTVFTLQKRAEKEFCHLLGKISVDNLFLHYSGYGYEKRGCPKWLINSLKTWKKAHKKQTKLTIMFHELYAKSHKPWVSSFWLSGLQREIVAKLSLLCDQCLTSLESYSQIIENLSQGKHRNILFFPVFSNIGEPLIFPSNLSQRPRNLVIFGGKGQKIKVYKNSLPELNLVCCHLNIEKIVDIGPKVGFTLSKINGLAIEEKGILPSQEISQILQNSYAGFLDYNILRLAKSGIFASYCSHRLIPFCSKGDNQIRDDIKGGKHYLFCGEVGFNSYCLEDLQNIADNAYSWYQNHTLSKQTENIALMLKH